MDNILICYFSASGITRSVAEDLAELFNGDLFEIEPVEPYTTADLNWMDKKSRSSLEMADKTSRPAIKHKADNINDYGRVIIGFPVWWYTAPTIINTFIEENDLTGKDIYIFVTSGGSGVDGSLTDLRNTYPQLKFVSGIRIKQVDEEEIKNWLN